MQAASSWLPCLWRNESVSSADALCFMEKHPLYHMPLHRVGHIHAVDQCSLHCSCSAIQANSQWSSLIQWEILVTPRYMPASSATFSRPCFCPVHRCITYSLLLSMSNDQLRRGNMEHRPSYPSLSTILGGACPPFCESLSFSPRIVLPPTPSSLFR